MAMSTIFQIPFLWNCLAIGLTGTFYTALVSNRLETSLPENIKVVAVLTALGIFLIYWFRDCDPLLLGDIKQLDQLLPFYVKKHLTQYPGFSGLFLAGIVSAATSTISSIINSQAAVIYTDVVSHHFSLSELQATRLTRVLAFATGSVMTLYSAAIPYLGSLTRIMMILFSAATGPFVGMFLMALTFPCVNSKGAGTATLLAITFQLWLMYNKFLLDIRPTRIPVTLNNCPRNSTTSLVQSSNMSFVSSTMEPPDGAVERSGARAPRRG
ncbi:sodium-coupled monocarboxylate transporter 1 [Ixodes scapularis]